MFRRRHGETLGTQLSQSNHLLERSGPLLIILTKHAHCWHSTLAFKIDSRHWHSKSAYNIRMFPARDTLGTQLIQSNHLLERSGPLLIILTKHARCWHSTFAVNIDSQDWHSLLAFNLDIQHKHSTLLFNLGIQTWYSTFAFNTDTARYASPLTRHNTGPCFEHGVLTS